MFKGNKVKKGGNDIDDEVEDVDGDDDNDGEEDGEDGADVNEDGEIDDDHGSDRISVYTCLPCVCLLQRSQPKAPL